MLFQRKIDGAMKKLHEGSDAAEEERRKEAGEPYEEMERPGTGKGGYSCNDHRSIYHVYTGCHFSAWNNSCGRIFPVTLTGRRPPAQTKITVLKPREFEGGEKIAIWG